MKIFETISFLLNKYVDNNKCHKGTHPPENHMPTKGNFVVKTNIIYFINKKINPYIPVNNEESLMPGVPKDSAASKAE